MQYNTIRCLWSADALATEHSEHRNQLTLKRECKRNKGTSQKDNIQSSGLAPGTTPSTHSCMAFLPLPFAAAGRPRPRIFALVLPFGYLFVPVLPFGYLPPSRPLYHLTTRQGQSRAWSHLGPDPHTQWLGRRCRWSIDREDLITCGATQIVLSSDLIRGPLSSAGFRRFGDTFLDATLSKTLEAILASSTGVLRDLRGRLWDVFRLSSALLGFENDTGAWTPNSI
jgi:hypothetical protein